MNNNQWANYYNAALAAGQSSQQAKAYADAQMKGMAQKAPNIQNQNNNSGWKENTSPNSMAAPYKGPTNKQQIKSYTENTTATGNKASSQRAAAANAEEENMRNSERQDIHNKDKAWEAAWRKRLATWENEQEVNKTKEMWNAAKPALTETWNAAKPALTETWNNIKPAIANNFTSSFNNTLSSQPRENQYLEESARNVDRAAANIDAAAQANQQIANRDYKQMSAEEAATAGTTAAMNTTANMSGAAGAASAALAGQNNANQATNNAYQSAIARNQGRVDQQRELANSKRMQAADARSNAISARKEMAANITDKENTDKRNEWARKLIEDDNNLARREKELDIAEKEQRLANLRELGNQQKLAEEQKVANRQNEEDMTTQFNNMVKELLKDPDEFEKQFGFRLQKVEE